MSMARIWLWMVASRRHIQLSPDDGLELVFLFISISRMLTNFVALNSLYSIYIEYYNYILVGDDTFVRQPLVITVVIVSKDGSLVYGSGLNQDRR